MLPATAILALSSPSSNAAYAQVDKATSELLHAPDWTINIGICDTVNCTPWLAKDIFKALKIRLQHKNPNVQLLSLTLLETMVKNCGEHIHFQIADRNILAEMIKIAKKKKNMRVREKILVLIDSWQEAFGGRGGKHPQYYFAYDELKHSGAIFPRRSPDTVPILTPPATHQSSRQTQEICATPINSTTRLDEAMASKPENLSLSMIDSMKNVLDLLSDLLKEVNTKDRSVVKDEVVVDVVEKCRSNQKKLIQMLASTSDEEILRRGLEQNDILQNVLAKHDAIASGSPIPVHISSSRSFDAPESSVKPTENKGVNSKPSARLSSQTIEAEREEKEGDVILTKRDLKPKPTVAQNGAATTGGGATPANTTTKAAVDPSLTMALVVTDPPPPPANKTAEDMIDFLSLSLLPANEPPNIINQTPPVPAQPQPPTAALNSYVVPWAQSPPPQLVQPQIVPPPWAATPGYYSSSSTPYPYSPPGAGSYYNATWLSNGGDGRGSGGAGQKPFIPAYRLFEDLNVLGATQKLPANAPGPNMMPGTKWNCP